MAQALRPSAGRRDGPRVDEDGLGFEVVNAGVSGDTSAGGLARLAELIASAGASIREIVHDRAFAGPDLSAVRVVCVAETTGHDHVQRLHQKLQAAGLPVDSGSTN